MFMYKVDDYLNKERAILGCSICWEKLENDHFMFACGHWFHTSCLKGTNKCPSCKTNIFKKIFKKKTSKNIQTNKEHYTYNENSAINIHYHFGDDVFHIGK